MERSEKIVSNETTMISQDASNVYEEFFVPALFKEWCPRMTEAAEIKVGHRVLDIATGTGILARYIKSEMDADVTGLDINEAMLKVAAIEDNKIKWIKGSAESLPFKDNTFDAVVCQFGLMFFEDKKKALNEMIRVLKPGKKLVISVWDKLENSPGYLKLTELLEQKFGQAVAEILHYPFSLGNKMKLEELLSELKPYKSTISTMAGSANFPSISSWLYTDIRGWVFNEIIDDNQLDNFIESVKDQLKKFVTSGEVKFDMPAHIITVSKE